MNVAYHSARLEGKIARTLYYAALPLIVRYPARIVRELPLDVFPYSEENTLPERVVSIRSFLANPGRPNKLTVVSAGLYTPARMELLKTINASFRVKKTRPIFPSGF